MDQTDTSDLSPQLPKNWLFKFRRSWVASLLGEIVFGIIVVMPAFSSGSKPAIVGHSATIFSLIAVGLWPVMTAVAYFARSQMYKRNWRAHAVTLGGYAGGNILFAAAMVMTYFFAIVAIRLTGQVFPAILPALAALIVLILNFPTGKPMQPHPPVFGSNEPRT